MSTDSAAVEQPVPVAIILCRMRCIPDIATDRLGVFSYAEALSSGWTIDALRHAAASGRLVRMRPGVYATPHTAPGDRFEAARQFAARAAFAAGLANPCSWVSHASAAILRGLPVWRERQVPCLTVPPRFVGDVRGAHLHRAQSPPDHVGAVARVPTSSVARIVIDIGREDGALSALVTADAALHTGKVDRATLRDRVRECAGWPGVRAARQAIEFADGRSESPLESVSRFRLEGLVPKPELQVSIFGEDGEFVGRGDFYWDAEGVMGEADGLIKYDDDPQHRSLRNEKLRQVGFERLGLTVVRWTRAELSDIDALAGEINEARARAAQRREPRRWRALRSTEPGFAPFSGPNRPG